MSIFSSPEYKDEFMDILKKHILPLLPIKRAAINISDTQNKNLEKLIEIDEKTLTCNIYPEKNEPIIKASIPLESLIFEKSAPESLLNRLLDAPIDNLRSDKKNFKYYKDNLYLTAYELAVCDYLGNICYYPVISTLKKWSTQTYEGEHVQLALYMTPNTIDSSNENYLDFLENKYSAVLTNGTETAAIIDSVGHLCEYISLDAQSQSQSHAFVPYFLTKFANRTTQKYEGSNLVGFVLLNTGDILIIKSGRITFAFRNGKWIFFDANKNWSKFYNEFMSAAPTTDSKTKKSYEEKAKIIFESLIDVSFSHTGGCLAVVKDEDAFTESYCYDDQLDKNTPVINTNDTKEIQRNKKTIQLKKQILNKMLFDKTHNVKYDFFSLDRCIRKELLSLDGAVILSISGNVICAGAIVDVKSGSSGGGRTQAAKSLAEMGKCFSVKISEDGYIEAYRSQKEKIQIFLKID